MPAQQIFVGLLSLAISYYILNSWLRARKARRNGCEPPRKYPHKDPFLGLDLFFRRGKAARETRGLETQVDLYTANGPTIEINDLGYRNILTVEPDNVRALFTTQPVWGVQPLRLPQMGPFCGRGFLTTDGETRETSRKMFLPSFDRKATANFSSLEQFTQDMFEQIPRNGETVDMQPLLNSLFINATTLFLFGESIGGLDGSKTTDVSNAFAQAMYGCGMRIIFGPFRFLAATKSFRDACKTAQTFADHYVQKALDFANEDKRPTGKTVVLLQNLATQTHDQEHLRNEILQAFMVAQGTTNFVVANVLFLVARVPGLWAKLKAEAVASCGVEDLPTYEKLQGLQQLRNVINEALRLYPIVATNKRIALKDTTLPTGGGLDGTSPIFIAKGDHVSMSYYVMQRSKELWGDDADEFKPERWESGKPPKPYSFMPFGSGPRQCIGRDKGFMETAYVVVRLLQRFPAIESRDERPWKGKIAMSMWNDNGCLVAFKDA